MKLENWSLIPSKPFAVPVDRERVRLCGKVYGHPTRPDGALMLTSRVVAVKDCLVATKSGSCYELGEPEAEYEARFPNAKQRVLAREWQTYLDV